jgi:tRNA pseudouridine38-40 synthase
MLFLFYIYNSNINIQRTILTLFTHSSVDSVNIQFYLFLNPLFLHIFIQVAQFTTPFNYNRLDDLHSAFNGLLPKEIRIRKISPAHPDFHARFSTTSKVYRYKIYNEPVMDPFHRLYTFHSAYRLNPEAMREAAGYFLGKHDFSSFGNAPSRNDGIPNPVKEIFRFNINESVSYITHI